MINGLRMNYVAIVVRARGAHRKLLRPYLLTLRAPAYHDSHENHFAGPLCDTAHRLACAQVTTVTASDCANWHRWQSQQMYSAQYIWTAPAKTQRASYLDGPGKLCTRE